MASIANIMPMGSTTTGYLVYLPSALFHRILNPFLRPEQLIRLSCTCRQLHHTARSDESWRYHYDRIMASRELTFGVPSLSLTHQMFMILPPPPQVYSVVNGDTITTHTISTIDLHTTPFIQSPTTLTTTTAIDYISKYRDQDLLIRATHGVSVMQTVRQLNEISAFIDPDCLPIGGINAWGFKFFSNIQCHWQHLMIRQGKMLHYITMCMRALQNLQTAQINYVQAEAAQPTHAAIVGVKKHTFTVPQLIRSIIPMPNSTSVTVPIHGHSVLFQLPTTSLLAPHATHPPIPRPIHSLRHFCSHQLTCSQHQFHRKLLTIGQELRGMMRMLLITREFCRIIITRWPQLFARWSTDSANEVNVHGPNSNYTSIPIHIPTINDTCQPHATYHPVLFLDRMVTDLLAPLHATIIAHQTQNEHIIRQINTLLLNLTEYFFANCATCQELP